MSCLAKTLKVGKRLRLQHPTPFQKGWRVPSFLESDRPGLNGAAARRARLIYQSEQVADCAGPCARLNGSADNGSLSCWANVCGDEIEVWTEAEAQRPKTLQQPVKDIRNSPTNGTSSLFIILISHLWVKEQFGAAQLILRSRPGQFVLDIPNTAYCRDNRCYIFGLGARSYGPVDGNGAMI